MNWDRFKWAEIAFSALDLDARLAFRSATSISFRVEWNSHDDDLEFRRGWIDVHYPCEGDVEAMIRISLTPAQSKWECQKAILDALLLALDLSPDATYVASFFSPTSEFEVVNYCPL